MNKNMVKVTIAFLLGVLITFIPTHLYHKYKFKEFLIADRIVTEGPNITLWTDRYGGYQNLLKDDPDLTLEDFILCGMESDFNRLMQKKERWETKTRETVLYKEMVDSFYKLQTKVGEDFLKEYKGHQCEGYDWFFKKEYPL